MSKRELTNLIREGTMTTASRLRSGAGESSQVQDMEDDTSVEGAGDSREVQELQQKLTMAEEKLESVRTDLTKQLQQTREMAEHAKGVRNSIARFKNWNASWRNRLRSRRN